MAASLTSSRRNLDELEETVSELLSARDFSATPRDIYQDLEWEEIDESEYDRDNVERAIQILANYETISRTIQVNGEVAYRLDSYDVESI